jgi:Tol biopolymer transport system component
MDEFQLGSDWSPDGKRVIGECPGPGAGICELDPQRKTVRTLLIQGKDQLLYPSWSWDGKAIVFMRRRSPADTSIVIAAATRDRVAPEESWVEISQPRTENSRPRFNADGSMVYYVGGRNGQRVLVGQKIERSTYKPAGDPVQLVRTPIEMTGVTGANGPYPLITVTPKRLFYSVMRESGNLWMMKLE